MGDLSAIGSDKEAMKAKLARKNHSYFLVFQKFAAGKAAKAKSAAIGRR